MNRGDPGIPRSMPQNPTTPTLARLVDYGSGGIRLVARDRANTWPVEQVQFSCGPWGGSGVEGSVRYPRPWRFDDQQKPVVVGDLLLIMFLLDDYRLPVVVSALIQPSIDPKNVFPTLIGGSTAPSNGFVALWAALDADGRVKGTVQIRAAETDGRVSVACSNGIDIEVEAIGGPTLAVLLENGAVNISVGGPALPLVRNDLCSPLAEALQEVVNLILFLNTAGIYPDPPVKLPALVAALNLGSYQTTTIKAE